MEVVCIFYARVLNCQGYRTGKNKIENFKGSFLYKATSSVQTRLKIGSVKKKNLVYKLILIKTFHGSVLLYYCNLDSSSKYSLIELKSETLQHYTRLFYNGNF